MPGTDVDAGALWLAGTSSALVRTWHKVVARAGTRAWRGWCHAACCAAVDVVRNASSAAVGLRSPEGVWELAAATDQWAESLEEQEYALGEGPASAAYASGFPVISDEPAAEQERWPAFSRFAASTGLSRTIALPLAGADSATIGTLSIYSRKAQPLGAQELLDSLTLARLVTAVLLTDLDGLRSTSRAEGPGPSAERRIRIAAGMVAGQLGVDAGEALSVMKARAFATGCNLSSVADRILKREITLA